MRTTRWQIPLALLCATPLAAPATAQGPGPGLPPVPVPPGNPITAEKADLGKALFWDEQLSSGRTVSCGTCHIPTAGGGDPRALSQNLNPGLDGVFGTPDDVVGSAGVIRSEADGTYTPDGTFGLGVQTTGRNAPTMINAAFSPELFWDGRAGGTFTDPMTGAVVLPNGAALETQAAGPPLSDVEMGHEDRDWEEVADRVAASNPLSLADNVPAALAGFINGRSYPELFEEVFGTDDVTPERILLAIATYERTLISDQTPFDTMSLTPQEFMGLQVFNGPGRCNLCHGGPLFTDNAFHNIGVRPIAEDAGRQAVTGLPLDAGRFKTPGLRNVGLSAPYFHNGSAATLEEVVAFYNRGGDFPQNQDPLMIPLGLSPQEQTSLVAFLRTGLLDPRVENGTAPFDRPTQYSETNRVPQGFGQATAGTDGFEPRMVAVEPANLGNPSMTVGVEDVNGGSLYYLLVDTANNPGGITVLGASLYFGFTSNLSVLTSGPAEGTGAGQGWASVSVPVPLEAALLGVPLCLQWIGFDAGAMAGLAASGPVTSTVF